MNPELTGQLDQAVEKAIIMLGDSKAGKLQKAANIITTLGLTGYDLEQPAKLLLATLQGFFYRIPRVKGTALAREFKIITGVKLPGSKFAAEGVRGNSATISLTPYSFSPKTVSSGVFQVTREAIAAAGTFDNALNRATMLAMKLGLKNEAAAKFGGNPYYLGTPTITLLTENTSVKSLKVPLVTAYDYYVFVRAMTASAAQDALSTIPNGQALPDPTDKSFSAIASGVSLLDGYGTPSTAQTTSTCIQAAATDSSINLEFSVVPGAVAYGIFVGVNTTHGATALTIVDAAFIGMVGQNSVVIKDLVFTGTKASATQAYYDGDGTAQAKNTATDTSGDTRAYPGIVSQLFGLVASGGTPTYPAQLLNVNGKLSASQGDGIPEINDLLIRCYYALYQSDDVTLLFSPADRANVNRAYGAGATSTTLRINLPAGVGQASLRAGIFVDGYIHPCTGRAIPCETDPNIPQGNFGVFPNTMPYPDTNIENPIVSVMLDEWINFEYAQTAPRKDYENRCYGGLVVYVPIAFGWGYNMFRG